MVEVNKNRRIEVFGVCFGGVPELSKLALSKKSKNGVYVGGIFEKYPCFDSSDYAYENRYYSYFFFALNKEELECKLDLLKNIRKKNSVIDVANVAFPVIYWAGDTYHPMQIPECDEIVILEEKKKVKPITTHQSSRKTRINF